MLPPESEGTQTAAEERGQKLVEGSWRHKFNFITDAGSELKKVFKWFEYRCFLSNI